MVSKVARNRSKEKTFDALSKAIDDFASRGDKISISAIARFVGVTPSLIHNTYPDIAERIRALGGKSLRVQRDSQRQALALEKDKNKKLRTELLELKKAFAKLASVNQLLSLELENCRTVKKSKVVPIGPGQASQMQMPT